MVKNQATAALDNGAGSNVKSQARPSKLPRVLEGRSGEQVTVVASTQFIKLSNCLKAKHCQVGSSWSSYPFQSFSVALSNIFQRVGTANLH